MRRKLISKGFVPRNFEGNEIFEGEFNGQDVDVHIKTYKDKVCRICVFDKNTVSAASIKVRFNNLVYQFEHNRKYAVTDSYTIPDDVDISYEMNVKNKKFEALYFQKDLTMQELEIDTLSFLTDEELQLRGVPDSIQAEYKFERDRLKLSKKIHDITIRTLEVNRPVWFCISQYGGEYYISMYYDNEYNKPQGEDL